MTSLRLLMVAAKEMNLALLPPPFHPVYIKTDHRKKTPLMCRRGVGGNAGDETQQ